MAEKKKGKDKKMKKSILALMGIVTASLLFGCTGQNKNVSNTEEKNFLNIFISVLYKFKLLKSYHYSFLFCKL